MKPKHLLLCLLLLIAPTLNAQTILKGDMNNDTQVNIADVTSLVDVVLGKAPQETISIGSPYMVDNSYVVGTWYAPNGTHFTLNADGTTDYGENYTYKFRPYQGTLMFFDASGKFVKSLTLYEVEKTYLLAVSNFSGTSYTYYTSSASLVTGLTMSESALTMNSGTTSQLSVIVTPSDALNTAVKWVSSDNNVATVDANGQVTAVAGGSCTITATAADGSGVTATCEVTVIQLVTKIELSSTSLVLKQDSYQKLTATVLPSNAANSKVIWSSSDESVAEVTSTGGVVAVGLGKCTIICTAEDGSGLTATCIIRVIGTEEHMFVDLGLPSGTLWATYNIGASIPEDYGDYFAWGETVPYGSMDMSNEQNYANTGSYTKTTFSWSTYKWCKGTEHTLTKYCSYSDYGYEGFTDTLKELILEDDAAYVNWGPTWHMPSGDQFYELTSSTYTTTKWTTQNGVYGLKITSKSNGNSIFFPAAGVRNNGTLGAAGNSGLYYSRSCGFGYYGVTYMYCTSTENGTGDNDRYRGLSIRPVRISE